MAYFVLVYVLSMKRSARVAARGAFGKKCKKRTSKKSPARAVPANNKRQRKTDVAESNVGSDEPSDRDLLKLLLEKVTAQQE